MKLKLSIIVICLFSLSATADVPPLLQKKTEKENTLKKPIKIIKKSSNKQILKDSNLIISNVKVTRNIIQSTAWPGAL